MNIENKRKEIEKFFKKYETNNLDIKCETTSNEDCINVHFCFYSADEDINKGTFDNIINEYKKENQEDNLIYHISDTNLNGAKVYFCMITYKGEK